MQSDNKNLSRDTMQLLTMAAKVARIFSYEEAYLLSN